MVPFPATRAFASPKNAGTRQHHFLMCGSIAVRLAVLSGGVFEEPFLGVKDRGAIPRLENANPLA
jgi:hypothetical protein